MNESLKLLIAESVSKNVVFSGAVGTTYTVQDLIHNVGVKSINNMWKRTKKELEGLSTDSLFNNANSNRSRSLQLQLDTLQEVFAYKQALTKAAIETDKRKREATEKLAILKKIKTEKELEDLKKMDIKDIDKEIEKYS